MSSGADLRGFHGTMEPPQHHRGFQEPPRIWIGGGVESTPPQPIWDKKNPTGIGLIGSLRRTLGWVLIFCFTSFIVSFVHLNIFKEQWHLFLKDHSLCFLRLFFMLKRNFQSITIAIENKIKGGFRIFYDYVVRIVNLTNQNLILKDAHKVIFITLYHNWIFL